MFCQSGQRQAEATTPTVTIVVSLARHQEGRPEGRRCSTGTHHLRPTGGRKALALGSKKRGEHWTLTDSLPKQGKLPLSPRKESSLLSMKLTYQKIMDLRSLNGGWNSEVLGLMGIAWPPQRGWLKRLVNSDIEESAYSTALEIKDSHLKPRTIERLKANSPAKPS